MKLTIFFSKSLGQPGKATVTSHNHNNDEEYEVEDVTPAEMISN